MTITGLTPRTSECLNLMPGLEIPPWIQAADPASHMARGMSIGVQLASQQAEERYRQAQLAQRQQQEAAQMSAQQAAQQFEEQYKMQAAARAEQQHSIENQMAKQAQDLAATQAAKKFEAIQNYTDAVNGGMDYNEAILKFGPGMGQGTAEAAAIRSRERTAEKAAAQPVPMPTIMQMDIGGGKTYPVVVDKKTGRPTIIPPQAVYPSQKRITGQMTEGQRQNFIDRKEKELQKIQDDATFDLSLNAPDESWSTKKKADFTRVKARMTQLQSEIDRLSGGGSVAAPGSAVPGAPGKSGRVKVKDPSGKVGTIPEDQLDEALDAGYTEVE